MPLLDFSAIPDDGRVWLFAAAAPLDDVDEQRLLSAVDGFLMTWAAHGQPLHCAREWRDERFLAVAVDTAQEGASGCSVDGLFRVLKKAEGGIGTTLLDHSFVYYRDAAGFVHGVSREDFAILGRAGDVTGATPVFDLSLTEVGAYRQMFERRASESWHAALMR